MTDADAAVGRSGSAVGVDVGGTNIAAGVVADGGIIGRCKLPTPSDGDLSTFVDAIADSVRSAMERAGSPVDGRMAVGVGLPGHVLGDGATLNRAPNLKIDTPVDLRAPLSAALGTDHLYLANDVNAAALGEQTAGAAFGQRDVLAVAVGTGVGGALILDGALRAGPNGLAGEVGHMVIKKGGRKCGCGERGHLEAYAGRAGMERAARRAINSGTKSTLTSHLERDGMLKSRAWQEAASGGDDLAKRLLGQAATSLGIAIASISSIVDFSMVVIGGGVVERLGDPFCAEIEKAARDRSFGNVDFEIRRYALGADAGLVGGAALASYSVMAKGESPIGEPVARYDVHASGGVLIRSRDGSDRGDDRDANDLEVLLVHRPRYDDWSFPKGKREGDETAEQCGLREVAEETGYVCALGDEVARIRYVDNRGRFKLVRYWLMRTTDGVFEPNDEVDIAEWLSPQDARVLLSYERDRTVLDAAMAVLGRAGSPAGQR